MWLSSSKKYAMDRFLEERASCVSVHHVCGNGILPSYLWQVHPRGAVTPISKNRREMPSVSARNSPATERARVLPVREKWS
jgi:hypothetical protein